MRAPAVLSLALLFACSPSVRDLTIAPSLPEACLAGLKVNEVRVSGLGDFPPAPASVASGTPGQPTQRIRLPLPKGTQVVAVEGLGTDGVVAFGRTPIALDSLVSNQVPVAYGPPDGVCATGKLNFARAGHRATRLPGGSVLVSGGVDAEGFAVPRLELYSPFGDLFGAPASFRVVDVGGGTALDARQALGHAVAVLATGGIYVTGGAPARAGVASGIAFEGAVHLGADAVADAPPGLLGGGPRAFHTATSLADGHVVLTGGCAQLVAGDCAPGAALATTTLYDPRTGAYTDGPPLLQARWDHDAILRGDGSILIVGGRGEGQDGGLPLELFDPFASRGVAVGPGAGRGALLATGAIALVGGGGGVSLVGELDRVALWESASEAPVELTPLAAARSGHTVTALEDGTLLIAGGAGAGSSAAPLELYDGRGRARVLDAPFARQRHSATRLGDGTVLLAGGGAAGAASTDAFLYLRSPLGPFSNLPTLTFEGMADPIDARRPDAVSVVDNRLRVSAAQVGEGGRPGELALVSGMRLDGFELDLDLGRVDAAGAAILLGWQSEAAYAFVSLEPGRPVALWTVTPGLSGQSLVAPVSGCSGVPLEDAELPDGGSHAAILTFRAGTLQLGTADPGGRAWLTCAPKDAIGRGAVGVGALHGIATFDNLQLSR